jgi:preprotein translocase subunit SecA
MYEKVTIDKKYIDGSNEFFQLQSAAARKFNEWVSHNKINNTLASQWAKQLCWILLAVNEGRGSQGRLESLRIVKFVECIEEDNDLEAIDKDLLPYAQIVAVHSQERCRDFAMILDSWPVMRECTLPNLQKYYNAGHQYISHPQVFSLRCDKGTQSIRAISDQELAIREAFSKLKIYPTLLQQDNIIVPALEKSSPNVRACLLGVFHKLGATKEGIDRYVNFLERLSRSEFKDEQKINLIDSCSEGRSEKQELVAVASAEATNFKEELKKDSAIYKEKGEKELYNAFRDNIRPDGEIVPADALKRAINLLGQVKEFRKKIGPQISSDKFKSMVSRERSADPGGDRHKMIFFAGACEIFRKHFGVTPNNTQLVATFVLADQEMLRCNTEHNSYRGLYAQVETGEGKSLISALLAGYFVSLGRKVDILTTNSYLARRDCAKFQYFYKDLYEQAGSFQYSSGAMNIPNNPSVLYTTINDLCFYYLACRTTNGGIGSLQNRFDTTIVDEADLVFLPRQDEYCRISSSNLEDISSDMLPTFLAFGVEYGLDRIEKDLCKATEQFKEYCPLSKNISDLRLGLYLNSLVLLQKLNEGVDYVIKNGKIVVVDVANTGRLQQTEWLYGLDRFVAMKHNLQVPKSRLLNSQISNISLLDKYRNGLYCVSGTFGGSIERAEIQKIHNLRGFDVPPHKPSQRTRLPLCFSNREDKWMKRLEEQAIELTQGDAPRAVLLVTESIAKSNQLYNRFKSKIACCQLLNDFNNLDKFASQSDEESVVSKIGNVRTVTIATSVAGRGADPRPENVVNNNGGLHVIITRVPVTLRIERQEEGRTARIGMPGSIRMLICIETDPFINSLQPEVKEIFLSILERHRDNQKIIEQTLNVIRDCENLVSVRIRTNLYNRQKNVNFLQEKYFEELSNNIKIIQAKNLSAFSGNAHLRRLVIHYMNSKWPVVFDEFCLTIENYGLLRQDNIFDRHSGVSDYFERQLRIIFRDVFRIYDPEEEKIVLHLMDIYHMRLSSIEASDRLLRKALMQSLNDDAMNKLNLLSTECREKFSNASSAEIKLFGKSILADQKQIVIENRI